ncbi:MAG: hypothetical protein IT350_10885 [Deltaproteobacteria bacterium]|nr:hypothetical protein [Deltaproteobacteria bacterium]
MLILFMIALALSDAGCGGGSGEETRSANSADDDDDVPIDDDSSPDDDSADDDASDDDASDDDASDDDHTDNSPPVLDAIGPRSTGESEELEFAISATDADGDDLTFSATNLPPGAIFDEDTATFSWAPVLGQAGTWPGVRFLVTDGHAVDEESITISVGDANFAPVLEPIGPQSIDEGELLVLVLNAADPDGDPVTYTVDTVPSGALFFPAYGVFLWTPDQDQAGDYAVTFGATDGMASTTEDVDIAVGSINLAPRRILPLNDVGFDEDADAEDILDYDLFFVDGDGDPLTFTFAGESPLTLSVDGENRLDASAPPDWNGTIENVTVTATDPDGLSASGVFDIHVNPVNDAPVIVSTPGVAASLGSNYTYDIVVNDIDASDHIDYEILQGPSGAFINGVNGRLTWTPQPQHWGSPQHYRIKVTDLGGLSDEQEWDVAVSATTIRGNVFDVFTGSPAAGELVALVDRTSGQALRNTHSDAQGDYEIPYYPSDLANSELEFSNGSNAFRQTRASLPVTVEGEITVDHPLVPVTFQNQQKILERDVPVCDLDADGVSEAGDCPVFPVPVTVGVGFSDSTAITEALDRLEDLAGDSLFIASGTPQTGGLHFTHDAGCGAYEYVGDGEVCFGSTAPVREDVVRGILELFGYREDTEVLGDLDINNGFATGAFTHEDASLVLLVRALIENGYFETYDFLAPLWTLEGDDAVFTMEDVAGNSQGVVNGTYPNYEIRGRLRVIGTLVVLPGTHIRMNFALEVTGAIIALGDADSPIVFEGIKAEPGAWGKVSLDQTSGAPSVFEYVSFENATLGLSLVGVQNPFPNIENCDFRASHAGLAVWEPSPDASATIANSLFSSGGAGIWWSAGGAHIVNSVFALNRESIFFGECTASTTRNSISFQNDRTLAGDACVQFLYSDILDTVSAPGGTGSMSVNPQFESASDFRLKPQSTLINAGDPSAIYNDPDASRNDMGLYGGPKARD